MEQKIKKSTLFTIMAFVLFMFMITGCSCSDSPEEKQNNHENTTARFTIIDNELGVVSIQNNADRESLCRKEQKAIQEILPEITKWQTSNQQKKLKNFNYTYIPMALVTSMPLTSWAPSSPTKKSSSKGTFHAHRKSYDSVRMLQRPPVRIHRVGRKSVSGKSAGLRQGKRRHLQGWQPDHPVPRLLPRQRQSGRTGRRARTAINTTSNNRLEKKMEYFYIVTIAKKHNYEVCGSVTSTGTLKHDGDQKSLYEKISRIGEKNCNFESLRRCSYDYVVQYYFVTPNK